MPSVDQLQIELQASSQDATNAINNLTTALKNLNKQLGLKDGTKFATTLNSMAKAMDSFASKTNSASGFANVIKGAEETKGAIAEVEEGAKNLRKTLDGLTFSKKTISGKDSNKGDLTPKNYGWISDIKEMENAGDYAFNQMNYNINEKFLPAVINAREQIITLKDALELPQGASFIEPIKMLPAVIQQAQTETANLSGNFEKMLPAVIQVVDNIKSLREYLGISNVDYSEPVRGFLENVQDVKASADSLKESFDDIIEVEGEFIEEVQSASAPIQELSNGMKEAAESASIFKDSSEPIEQLSDGMKKVADSSKKVGESNKHLGAKEALENFVVLGEELEKVSRMFDELAEKSTNVFKFMTAPLKSAIGEYTEKLSGAVERVKEFRKNVQSQLTKLSAFWKRTMRTFTFMIIRKAITEVIKEIGTATQSMALFSNMMGTMFNSSISSLVADFQYLGRSIVSVFAPLINIIAPIIDAIVSRIATLLSYIGMLIAALGGQASFTKAKKNVENYAESLDDASKSAKNLTMGIDELNILSENSGGSSKPYDGWEDAWEEVDIPDWIKDIADWLKDFWKRFFAPLLEAWNRAKQYLIDGFKTMLDSLKRLFGHIIDDFLTMWNQEATIHMFEQMLRIVGDLMRVVRNLADQFDKAWEKGKVGLKIFENLRDIMAILVEHARNVSYYMIGWAKSIDFSPLLESFEKLTRKMKPLADFIGGLFEDAMELGVLKYIKFLIEKGIPEVQETLADVLDTFNFNALRDRLKPLWTAFEEMFERIHEGSTKALGELGKEVARFTNSKDFTDFLQRIVDITKLVTAERVEKLLTGISKGIIAIAKAIVKFVNSKPFMAFLEGIAKWVDSKSVDEIASILTNIANAIVLFKFGAFATEKLGGFFKFFAIITALKNIKSIAGELTHLGTALNEAGVGAEKLGTYAKGLEGVGAILGTIAKAAGGVFVAFEEFKHVGSAVEDLTLIMNGGDQSLGGALTELIATVGIAAGAFTLLFGFPAGIIATGCIAAVAAIKGIADAIDQINFDRVTDAILTQGEMTVQQVKEWYSQATETVNENIQMWKDAERNLTQDRGDLEAYSRSLQELGTVFLNTGQITASMADTLCQKYKDMGSAIENYINQSTDAIATNLMAQRDFLIAQGVDVDQMIVDLYRAADEEKAAVSGSVDAVKEAIAGLDGLTEGTQAYNDQMQVLKDAIVSANEELKEYYTELENVDTSEAVAAIEALGESLDLSQYGGDWEAAYADIKGHIDEVKATYSSKMGELKDESERLKEEIDLMPNISDETKEAAKLSIDHAYEEAGAELAAKTEEVLALYSSDLSSQFATVATQAASDWENGLVSTFLQPYSNKEEYILTQLYDHNNRLIEEGIQDSLKEAYAALPDNTTEDVVTAMSNIVENEEGAYRESLRDGSFYDDTYDIFHNILGQCSTTLGVDAEDMGLNTVLGYNKGIEDNSDTTQEPINNWFSKIKNWIHDLPFFKFGSPNLKMIEFGKDTVEGFNLGIKENASTTQSAITEWFKYISSAFKEKLMGLKTTFNEFMTKVLSGEGIDVAGSISTLFAQITPFFLQSLTTFGEQLLSVTIPEFFTLYIMPFATLEKWQPLFDTLLNEVFIPAFENFKTWFMDDAMTPWWEEDLLSWFAEDLWDEDIFEPLGEHIQEHWDNFIDWWDDSMNDWWNNKVVPWFARAKWIEQFDHILQAAKQVFDQIRDAIKERINQAKEAVVAACEEMKSALQSVLELIAEVMAALEGMDGLNVSTNVTGFSPTPFATGGFPAYGSLFVAGEPGAKSEWVGNINGRTGVVSNGEITGIADAVYATGNTESELLSQLLSINRQILDKEVVVIGDKDIARLAVRGQSKLGMNIIT